MQQTDGLTGKYLTLSVVPLVVSSQEMLVSASDSNFQTLLGSGAFGF